MREGYSGVYKDSYVDAYHSIKPKWCECAAITALFLMLGWTLSHLPHWLFLGSLGFLTEGSKMGVSRFILQVAKNKDEELTDFAYSLASIRNFCLLLTLTIVGIPALTLGYLLLILPGIYLTLLFSIVQYVAADQPKLGLWEVWEEAINILSGNTLGFLCLKIQLWLLSGLLSIMTLGIGTFWVLPYTWNVEATFYLKMRESKGGYNVADTNQDS